ncbi:15671_t:CDS:2, partial [Funneliformis mosseae]
DVLSASVIRKDLSSVNVEEGRNNVLIKLFDGGLRDSINGNCECTSAKTHVGREKVATSTFEELADIIIICRAYKVLTDKLIIGW